MTAMTELKPPDPWFPKYRAEREENRRLYDLLDRSLLQLEMVADQREAHGQDTATLRAFIGNARKEAVQ